MTRVRAARVALVASALCVGLAHLFAQQTPPPRDARPPASVGPVNQPAGTATIGGIVTNDDGSKPVKFAYVMLIAPATGAAKVSQTDADGRFVFANLPADRYTVAVTKPPYLGMVAGARRPGRPGTPIALAEGQKINNITIRMPMGAAITGVIMDEKGQPARVSVSAYQWRLQNGERVPVAAGVSSLTDDRGRYRLFGLMPGDYLVAAQTGSGPPTARVLSAADVDGAIRNQAAPFNQPQSTSARYAGTLFPGTARAQDAITITLAAGEERANVDMRLQVTRAARVEGVVTSSDGQLPQRLSVSLRTKGVGIYRQVTSATVQPDGTFAFPAVPPDTFYLSVNAGGQPPQFATTTIEVAGVDVMGLQLALRPGSVITGSFVFRGTARPPALAGWRPLLRQLGNAFQPAGIVSNTDDSGSFTVQNVYPGSYVVGGASFGSTPDNATWTVESVVADGRDVTDLPIEVSADNAPRNLVLTFTDRSQELSGRITRTNGAPAPEYTVVIFPEDKAYWISGSRRILTARPGTDGKFVLSAAGPTTLPPGRYLLAAVTDLDRDEQFDPGFLGALVPAAVPVTLQPGEKKVQDLRVK